MTKKEMTEIFAVMKLAYPNAEMFKGGIETLKPTIELWASCLADVDFWTGNKHLPVFAGNANFRRRLPNSGSGQGRNKSF